MANWDHKNNIGTHPVLSDDPSVRLPAALEAARNNHARSAEVLAKAQAAYDEHRAERKEPAQEFHAQALAGGASRHYETGNVPDRGFMVGGARDLSNQPYPEINRPVDQFSLDDVRHHARALRESFGPGREVHQGAWREGDNVVLDASDNIPTYSSAMTEAKMRGERAVYDVRRGKDRNVSDLQGKVKN